MTSLREDVRESFDEGPAWMQQMMTMKGNIKDFHQMYLVEIGENEKPFNRDVKDYSNELVNEWFERCLVPHADEAKKMTSQEVTDRWYSFYEAKQTRTAMENWNLGFHPTEEQIEEWLILFDGPVDKLAELGIRTVRDGFTILIAAYDDWYVKEKWELCFGKDDPNVWYKTFKEQRQLFTRERSPFDIDKIREKVGALMNPENEPGPKKDMGINMRAV